MLGRKKLHQVYRGLAGSFVSEQVNVRGSPFVDARLIRQQPDSLSSDQLQAVT